MGETGMDEMMEMGMPGPENTLPMMAGEGPFGMIGMGGMFTTLKVHDDMPRFASQEEYAKRIHQPKDGGWYRNPPGTVAESVTGKRPKQKGMTGQEHGGMKMEEKAPAGAEEPEAGEAKPKPVEKTLYRCPMGHVVHQAEPGECPVCGMKLRPETPEEQAAKKDQEE